jgi:fatty acid desaturase
VVGTASDAACVATGYPKSFITHSHTQHHRAPDVMERLLEYLLRHPVAETRTRYQPRRGTMTIYYKEQRYEHGAMRRIGKREVLTVREFLVRLACHIPELGFQTVRYYGVYANAYKGRALDEKASAGLLQRPTRAGRSGCGGCTASIP